MTDAAQEAPEAQEATENMEQAVTAQTPAVPADKAVAPGAGSPVVFEMERQAAEQALVQLMGPKLAQGLQAQGCSPETIAGLFEHSAVHLHSTLRHGATEVTISIIGPQIADNAALVAGLAGHILHEHPVLGPYLQHAHVGTEAHGIDIRIPQLTIAGYAQLMHGLAGAPQELPAATPQAHGPGCACGQCAGTAKAENSAPVAAPVEVPQAVAAEKPASTVDGAVQRVETLAAEPSTKAAGL